MDALVPDSAPSKGSFAQLSSLLKPVHAPVLLVAKLGLVLVEEPRGQRGGQLILAARRVESDLAITAARHCLRASLVSVESRSASLVRVPGRCPSSLSACRARFRKVSGWISSRSPTRRKISYPLAGFNRASTTILVFLPRSASRRFPDAAILLIRRWDQSLQSTRDGSIPLNLPVGGMRGLVLGEEALAETSTVADVVPVLPCPGAHSRRAWRQRSGRHWR